MHKYTTIALALLSGVLGLAVGTGRTLVVALIMAPIIVVALLPSASVRTVIVLAATSSFVFAWAAPSVAVGPVQVYIGELLLAAALLATALAYGRGSTARIGFDPVLGFMLLYLVGMIVGVVVGLYRGTDFSLLVAGARAGVFVMGFFVFRVSVSEPAARTRTLLLLSILAVAIVVGQALQVVVGQAQAVFLVGSFTDLVASDPATGFLRVRPPGLYLVYVTAAMSASYVLWGPRRGRLWAIVVLLVSLIGVALSLNRNMVIGLAVGLYLAFVFIRGRSRLLIATGVAAVLLLVIAVNLGPALLSSPVLGRFATLADPTERSVALADRVYESGLAYAAASRSPIVGIGWGTPYGASATRLFEGIVAARNRDYVHNQYLAAWLRMGLVGLIAFVGVIVSTMVAGVRSGSAAQTPENRWLGPAVMSGMTALATSAAVDMVLLSPSNIGVFAFVAALGSALYSVEREDAGDTP